MIEIIRLIDISDGNTIVLKDIDDTLITPISDNTIFIDELKAEHKKDPTRYPHFDEMISIWRLERKMKLVSVAWPTIIEQFHQKKSLCYALAQMNVGKVGYIESMSTWRYTELKTLGIQFTRTYNGERQIDNFIEASQFSNGIFMSPGGKNFVVEKILHDNPHITRVIFIDDRKDHVADVKTACDKFPKVTYHGIVYRGVDLVRAKSDQNIMDLQKHLLSQKEPQMGGR